MLDLQNVYAYLKRVELGDAVAQVPQLSAMSMSAGAEAAMPARVFSHEAAVFYLVDDPNQFIYVTESDMAAAGINEDELHALGVANLERLLSSLTINEANGALIFSGSGNFEASMLLVPSLWDTQLASRFPNGPVVSIAARDILAVCDKKDAGGLAVLQGASKTLWDRNGDHLLARDLYERGPDGTWVPFSAGGATAPAEAAPTPAVAEPVVTESAPKRVRVADAGLEEIVISNDDLGGMLDRDQLMKMQSSGYAWNPDSQCFHRLFVGEPGTPERPWTVAGWSTAKPKKRGFFKRNR